MLTEKKKRVLIYYPFNTKAVAIESQVEILVSLGYEVFLLTWNARAELHERCERLGARTFATARPNESGGVGFFLYQGRKLLSFCREHEIRIVFAHFQSVAMVAGLTSYFRKLRVIYFRHNADYFELRNSRKELFFNRMANRFSHTIIAISDNVRKQLLKEGVSDKKIRRINLAYNFSKYGMPDLEFAASVRKKYPASVLLLTAARLDPLKRHIPTFEIVKAIVDKGIDCKLICIGDGPIKEQLQQWIEEHKMTGRIILEGFVNNVIDYVQACDIMIHLSYSEASNQVVKEAGLCKKTAIVCKGVGNFEEYIKDQYDAFLIDKENPVVPAIQILEQYGTDREKLKEMGQHLHDVVMATFSISAVIDDYKKLLQ